jgi:hypothetical protein
LFIFLFNSIFRAVNRGEQAHPKKILARRSRWLYTISSALPGCPASGTALHHDDEASMGALTTPYATMQAGVNTVPQLFAISPACHFAGVQTPHPIALGDVARSAFDYTAGPPTVTRVYDSSVCDAYHALEKFSVLAGTQYAPVRTASWFSTEKMRRFDGPWDETKRAFDQRETKRAYFPLLSHSFAKLARRLEAAPTARVADGLLRQQRVEVARLVDYAWEGLVSAQSVTAVLSALRAINASSADAPIDFFDRAPEAKAEERCRERFLRFDKKLYWMSWMAFAGTIAALNIFSPPAIFQLTIFLPHIVTFTIRGLARRRMLAKEAANVHDDPAAVDARLESMLAKTSRLLPDGPAAYRQLPRSTAEETI